MANVPTTNISFYTASTPNGQKIAITLEELGIKYEAVHVDIEKGTQKEDWYLKINPNGRIPAIVDKTPQKDRDGLKEKTQEKRIFEGQAIMLYLVAKYDPEYKISYPYNVDKYWEIVEWMTWMQSGIGPMQGQANHFFRYAPEKIPYAIKRYQNETKRLYRVLEARLTQQKSYTAAGTDASAAGDSKEGDGPWIVGAKLTIADLACFSWVNWAEWAGVDLDSFPELKKWREKINKRPAVKRGLNVPVPWSMEEKLKNAEADAKKTSAWIMKGQEENQATG